MMLQATGDFCNLLGAIITRGVWTQILQGFYFMCVDFVLLSEIIIFNPNVWPRIKTALNIGAPPDQSPSGSSETLLVVAPALAFLPHALTHFLTPGQTTAVGWTIGMVSATSYLSSRLPQIWSNYRKASVDGISPTMFALAVSANGTYVLSILLNTPFLDGWAGVGWYYARQFPWLLGSAGTFMFDFCIVGQCVLYKGIRPRLGRAGTGPDMEPLIEADESALMGFEASSVQ